MYSQSPLPPQPTSYSDTWFDLWDFSGEPAQRYSPSNSYDIEDDYYDEIDNLEWQPYASLFDIDDDDDDDKSIDSVMSGSAIELSSKSGETQIGFIHESYQDRRSSCPTIIQTITCCAIIPFEEINDPNLDAHEHRNCSE